MDEMDFQEVMRTLLVAAVWTLSAIGSVGVPFALAWLAGIPMRRRERAALILDLLERGLGSGRTAEEVLTSLSESWDRTLGRKVVALATLLKRGTPLGPALDATPGFLPIQVQAVLRAGCSLGDIRAVLPACRAILDDAASETRASLNFLPILPLVTLPIIPAELMMLNIWVLPKMRMIWEDMGEGSETAVLLNSSPWLRLLLFGVPLTIGVVFCFAAVLHLASPWIRAALHKSGSALLDAMLLAIPWNRRRLLRDFAGMLGILLDSGIPESDAVRIAGRATANLVLERRALEIVERLRRGESLPRALATLDEGGELEWRMTTAAKSSLGFSRALEGWLEALNATAFRQEQGAAQTVSTGIVLANGLVVGLTAYGIFGFLLGILNSDVLW